MSDEISRRPQSTYGERSRGSTGRRSPKIVRALVFLSFVAMFMAGGYYSADLFLKLLDRKNVVKQQNVVSNAEDLQKLLAAGQTVNAVTNTQLIIESTTVTKILPRRTSRTGMA